MSQQVTAEIKSVNIQNAKSGDAGFSVVHIHDDGSQFGKRIYQWIWREGNKPDPNLLKWAQLAQTETEQDGAAAVLLSGALSGLEVDILVDTETDERFWKILSIGLVGTLEKSGVSDDEIPF